MHPKIALRIAENLTKVQRNNPKAVAAAWWQNRFSHITPEEHREVVEAMNKVARKK